MNAGTCWEQEYNRPNGLSVEKAPKSDLYLLPLLYYTIVILKYVSNKKFSKCNRVCVRHSSYTHSLSTENNGDVLPGKKNRKGQIPFKPRWKSAITLKVGLSHGPSGPHGEQTNICPGRTPNTGFSVIQPLAFHNETKARNLMFFRPCVIV